ncbi:MAG: proteasome endopeptidase complex, archaeal, beta subunit [Thermoprotei archaeon]|nr:MAG: proteasome endopeptidase complex, archaeal, beta subunit [Thermoprotei archaeon]RLF01293.1 MAG: proteasome endopeptidase complex, archaeal, beta subunit [Thermoprotei archaeon]
MSEYFTPGATVVGLVFKTGVILAAEKRVTYGFTLVSRSGKKVFKITDRLGIAAAGLISDMQAVAKVVAAEVNLYELENNRKISVKSAAKLLSHVLFSSRLMPYFTEMLIGGIDNTGPHLYVLDPLGSLIEDKYATLGTGTKIAIGILEAEYRDEMNREKAESLALKSIKTAIGRDAVSGDGIDILVIDENGAEEKFIPVRS